MYKTINNLDCYIKEILCKHMSQFLQQKKNMFHEKFSARIKLRCRKNLQ